MLETRVSPSPLVEPSEKKKESKNERKSQLKKSDEVSRREKTGSTRIVFEVFQIPNSNQSLSEKNKEKT